MKVANILKISLYLKNIKAHHQVFKKLKLKSKTVTASTG